MDDVCGVCGEKMAAGQEVWCGHSFCYLCVRRCLRDGGCCPMCRQELGDAEGDVQSGDPNARVFRSLCRLKRQMREARRDR